MWKLVFETLTPIHISNGNQLAYNLEYVVKDEILAKLNLNKASKVLAEKKLFDFKKNYKFYEVIKIIEKNKSLFSEKDFEYQIYCSDEFIEYLKNERRDGRKIVQEFINSNGKFYIPGSSIKGVLTTILHRDINKNPLGINPSNPNIRDKFVITDSDFISDENFMVDVAFRPPSVNLITLNPEVKFHIYIKSKGNMSVDILREKLKTYSFIQLQKAKNKVVKYKEMERKPGGATAYFNILQTMINRVNLDEDEYLINIGFGGGSYFKIYDDAPIPKFKNPGRKLRREEAHTTFTINIENEFYQLGWCKLKIEEV